MLDMDLRSVISGALLGAATVSLMWKYLPRSKTASFDDFIKTLDSMNANIPIEQMVSHDTIVAEEQFIRNEQFFGQTGQGLVSAGRVIVVGVGGVGSHCAVTLARSGVGFLRLIDFDRVTVSSLNRHASAVRSEVGITKVASLKRFIGAFAPDCEVDAVEALFNAESAVELISVYKPDFVVDAIDNIHTKADLLAYCHKHNIKVVCACGSAAKCDPTRIRISTLENSSEDPLARAVRQRLRLQHNLVQSRIPVVYSTERTTRTLLPLKEFQESSPGEYQTLEKFRVRILPVIAPLPAIMGNAIASYIVCNLAEQPFTPLSTAPASSASFRKKLWNFCRRHYAFGPHLADNGENILDLVFDACSGRSVISGDSGNLCIVPFRPTEPLSLCLMTSLEAKTHLVTCYEETEQIRQLLHRIGAELVNEGFGDNILDSTT